MATERLHRTLNKPRGRKAARRVNDGNAYGALSVPLRALPNSTAIVIHHAVLRKRRGGAQGIERIAAKLLLLCRTIFRSARISQ